MINAPSSWSIDEFKDLDAKNYYNEVREQTSGDPEALQGALERIQFIARDNARTPMQWNAKRNAGFSESAEPWMRVIEGYETINAEAQEHDKESVLWFWRRMLKLRKEHADVLVYGSFEPFDLAGEETFCFSKTWKGKQAIVVLNFTQREQAVALKQLHGAELLVSSVAKPTDSLAAFEGRIYLKK